MQAPRLLRPSSRQMPDPEVTTSSWDFESAIDLLGKLSFPAPPVEPESPYSPPPLSPLPSITAETASVNKTGSGLGDFSSLWDLLGSPSSNEKKCSSVPLLQPLPHHYAASAGTCAASHSLAWPRADSSDREDNTEPENVSEAGSLSKFQNGKSPRRSTNLSKAAQRAAKVSYHQNSLSDTEVKPDLLDKRHIIDSVLTRTRSATNRPSTPAPTLPLKASSPAKAHTSPRKQRSVAQSSLWTAPGVVSPSRYVIAQRDGLMSSDRTQVLISRLKQDFAEEKKYLKNKGLIEPTFTTLNVSDIGIHVFIDISNISIGFHDCLKISRGINPKLFVKQIPMNFHLFSLVLERGRPAAKRVLVGSDKSALVDQAKALGFETNILERVNKAKEPTARQKRFNGRSGGDTSGSETNTGSNPGAQRWVEQAVDEILHLKILESLIDYSDKPSTIVLATGDAAEAEYSGGFLRMVERALEKGWVVELVSFKLNTSNLYKRKDFRRRWGAMFKWVQLDDYAEMLIASDDSS